MTLGEKIKKARLDRHMTQNEVVGNYITRNMLSKIENNSATPSMKTLEYLAERLGLPAGYFVSDEVLAMVPTSMQAARQAFAAGDPAQAIALLGQVQSEEIQDERWLLLAWSHLQLAEEAARSNDAQSALAHLREALAANGKTIYHSVLLELKGQLLLARFDPDAFDQAMARYQELMPELGLQRLYLLAVAQHHLAAGDAHAAAGALEQLDEGQQETDYLCLQGAVSMHRQDYHQAVELLRRAEQLATGCSEVAMKPLYAMLEQCYREMEDYKSAYYYASKQIQR